MQAMTSSLSAIDACPATKLCAGSAEHRPDAIFRHPHRTANLLIAFAFKVIHPHHVGLGALQLVQQPADFLAIADSLHRLIFLRFGLCHHVAQGNCRSAFDQFPHYHAPGDHGQISGQRAAPAEVAQRGHIVIHDSQKNFGRQIFAIRRRKIDTPALGGVINYVNHEAHEAIDKILPRPRLPRQAAI
jgi:hypothetical protein